MRRDIVGFDPDGTRVDTASTTVTPSACFADAMIEGAFAIGRRRHQQRGWQPVVRSLPLNDGRVGLDDIAHWCSQVDTVSPLP